MDLTSFIVISSLLYQRPTVILIHDQRRIVLAQWFPTGGEYIQDIFKEAQDSDCGYQFTAPDSMR